MYPQQFFGLFPSIPTEPRVFVIMAFDDRHRLRWDKVIQPAILNVDLQPHRVDARRVSNSILTEILQGISSSRLVFAEVSPLDDHRNANVMYELGIAHAVRESTEVVIFRDDNDRLPFDVANVRVNRYGGNPDEDYERALESVQFALVDALKELNLAKSMAVQLAMRRLDQTSFNLLVTAIETGAIYHPQKGTMGQALIATDILRSLTLLLELGLLRPEYPNFYELAQKIGTTELNQKKDLPVQYKLTELGKAVTEKILIEHGGIQMVSDPILRAKFDQAFPNSPKV